MYVSRYILIVALLAMSPGVYAVSGSDNFICDLIEYSEDPGEIRAAMAEARERGICGFAEPADPSLTPEQEEHLERVDRAEAERKIFMGGAILCVTKGKCNQATAR